MRFLFEIINWWYSIVAFLIFKEKVIDIFIFSMNKTRALPFAKTFNVPLYQDTSGIGKSMSMIIKFWWISFGSIISIIKIIPGLILTFIVLLLPIIPIIGIARFLFKI